MLPFTESEGSTFTLQDTFDPPPTTAVRVRSPAPLSDGCNSKYLRNPKPKIRTPTFEICKRLEVFWSYDSCNTGTHLEGEKGEEKVRDASRISVQGETLNLHEWKAISVRAGWRALCTCKQTLFTKLVVLATSSAVPLRLHLVSLWQRTFTFLQLPFGWRVCCWLQSRYLAV
jgi:hypothetical protein